MEKWRELWKLLRSCGEKNDDQYLAMLDYRTTPLLDIDLSPAQLLMGLRLRNKLPMMESLLQPASNNQQSPGTLKRPKRIRGNITTIMQAGTWKNFSLELKFTCSLGQTPKCENQPLQSSITIHQDLMCCRLKYRLTGNIYESAQHQGIALWMQNCLPVQIKLSSRTKSHLGMLSLTKLEFPSCCWISHPRSKTCTRNWQRRTLPIDMSPKVVEK